MDPIIRGIRGQALLISFALLGLVMVTALAVSGCGSSSTSSSSSLTTVSTAPALTTEVTQGAGANAQGPGAKVIIKNGKVDPATLQVQVGTAVTFEDMDDDTTRTYHLVSSDGLIDTGELGQGGSYAVTFQKAGTVEYQDKNDPSIKGTIVVQ